MQVLFTRNPTSWFSKSIQAVTQEPVSHVAFQLGPWVLHATGRGIHAQTLSTFYKQNRVVFRVPIWGIGPDTVLQRFADREFRHYDFKGVLFFGLHLLARRVLPGLTPKVNLWQDTGMDFCVELVEHLLGKPDRGSMLTPYGLYKQLSRPKG